MLWTLLSIRGLMIFTRMEWLILFSIWMNGVIGNQRHTLFAPINTIIGRSCLEVVDRWKLLTHIWKQAEKKGFWLIELRHQIALASFREASIVSSHWLIQQAAWWKNLPQMIHQRLQVRAQQELSHGQRRWRHKRWHCRWNYWSNRWWHWIRPSSRHSLPGLHSGE